MRRSAQTNTLSIPAAEKNDATVGINRGVASEQAFAFAFGNWHYGDVYEPFRIR